MAQLTQDQILSQIYEANELATKLFDGIWEDGAMWMQMPNSLLFGTSPQDAIASGDGVLVINWLKSRLREKQTK